MKPKLILVEQEQTIEELLTGLELDTSLMFVSVNGKLVQDIKTVLLTNQEVMIFPRVSGGSESSFSIIDKGNRIEIGNSYTELEEEQLAFEDSMAIKLSRSMFIKELIPYAPSIEFIERLLKSDRCANCKKKLHDPTAWEQIELKTRRKYFKALVIIRQEQILLCCSCYERKTRCN